MKWSFSFSRPESLPLVEEVGLAASFEGVEVWSPGGNDFVGVFVVLEGEQGVDADEEAVCVGQVELLGIETLEGGE